MGELFISESEAKAVCPKKIKESVADCLIKIKKAKSNPRLSPDLFANVFCRGRKFDKPHVISNN